MVALISIVENFDEIQAIVMRLCSVSMVTVLLKVLFGSFIFMHIFCCIFHIFRFICAYYQSGRYNFITLK